MALKNILQGVLGNLSEVTPEQLKAEFGGYLLDDEDIVIGFKLVRDVLIFTDKRIISFDKQGTTGQKMAIFSITLSTITGVSAETAGFGLDDSEITIIYIATPYLRSNSPQMYSKKFEFPKSYNIQPVFKMLQQLAYDNFNTINK